MNRELLFKGWCPRNEKWIEGDVICKSSGALIRRRSDGMCFEVDPSTVCQYIGLPDRNGTKVFDGDIIQGYEGIFVVKYSTGGAMFVAEEVTTKVTFIAGRYQMQNDFEVVGNRWDNPELLEGGTHG